MNDLFPVSVSISAATDAHQRLPGTQDSPSPVSSVPPCASISWNIVALVLSCNYMSGKERIKCPALTGHWASFSIDLVSHIRCRRGILGNQMGQS